MTRVIDVIIKARDGMSAALNSARASLRNWSNSVAGNIVQAAAAMMSFRAAMGVAKFIVNAFLETANSLP